MTERSLTAHVTAQPISSIRIGNQWHHIVPGSLDLQDDNDTGDYWFCAQATFEDTDDEMIAGPWSSITAVSYPLDS